MAEIFVQLPAVERIGVCPFGAHVREMVGTSKKPLSSRKPKWAPSTAVFFYARPDVLFPVPNSLFVALPIAFAGPLATPTHRSHKLPDIGDGVVDAKGPTNELAYAAQRPQVGRVAGLQRTLQKQPCQALFLSLIQQRRSAGRWLHTQPPFPLGSVCLLPPHDRAQ